MTKHTQATIQVGVYCSDPDSPDPFSIYSNDLQCTQTTHHTMALRLCYGRLGLWSCESSKSLINAPNQKAKAMGEGD